MPNKIIFGSYLAYGRGGVSVLNASPCVTLHAFCFDSSNHQAASVIDRFVANSPAKSENQNTKNLRRLNYLKFALAIYIAKCRY